MFYGDVSVSGTGAKYSDPQSVPTWIVKLAHCSAPQLPHKIIIRPTSTNYWSNEYFLQYLLSSSIFIGRGCCQTLCLSGKYYVLCLVRLVDSLINNMSYFKLVCDTCPF